MRAARVVLSLAAAGAAAAGAPKIGIYPTIEGSYLDAYKEWIAQEGGTSTVFPSSFEGDQLEALFQSVNGFLIPGGGSKLSPAVKALIERAKDANKQGDYFPVWGTCLGFEWIVESVGGVSAIVRGFDSEHYPAPLNFTGKAAGSRTYAGANASLMNWLATEDISYNAHSAGIEPAQLTENKQLASTFDILSTSVDRKGRPFVAQIEAREYPIYANQFHPEKIQFVATSTEYPNIPRTPEAIAGARHLAQFFVAEAAKNKHTQ